MTSARPRPLNGALVHVHRLRLVRGLMFTGIAAAVTWNAQPIALGSIHFYQEHLSTLAARAGYRCRFTPTCSRYAERVIGRDGVVRGGWLALRRIARCGPWTPAGTRDEP